MRMSHDLRSPLNSVVTLSALLADGTPARLDRAGPLCRVIRHCAETLLARQRHPDLATIEAGRLEARRPWSTSRRSS
jgi:signal transduction histidine kinase